MKTQNDHMTMFDGRMYERTPKHERRRRDEVSTMQARDDNGGTAQRRGQVPVGMSRLRQDRPGGEGNAYGIDTDYFELGSSNIQ